MSRFPEIEQLAEAAIARTDRLDEPNTDNHQRLYALSEGIRKVWCAMGGRPIEHHVNLWIGSTLQETSLAALLQPTHPHSEALEKFRAHETAHKQSIANPLEDRARNVAHLLAHVDAFQKQPTPTLSECSTLCNRILIFSLITALQKRDQGHTLHQDNMPIGGIAAQAPDEPSAVAQKPKHRRILPSIPVRA